MSEFFYREPFPVGEDKTEYKLLTKDYVTTSRFNGQEVLHVAKEGLEYLARQAMTDVSFLLRPSHLEKVAKILDDPEASENDRYVARALLENSVISAEMELPTCQDTGTAIVVGKKGEYVFSDGDDPEWLSKGVYRTYTEKNLRYSQNVPLTMYDEKNTGNNLPAQIDLFAGKGNEYHFLFLAKGGGSANKTFLFQKTKALLNPDSLEEFLFEKIKSLGTAACPPYHIAFVIGGTSAEATLKTVKLASAGYYDNLPNEGNGYGQAFRDRELEEKMLKKAQEAGIGAQFGGKYLAHDIRIVRLPRHGASLPVGLGVSCSADRNIKAKITKDGLFLEKLESNPSRFIPESVQKQMDSEAVHIDLNQSMDNIRAELSKHPVLTRVMLNGRLIVARDIAHARIKERLDKGEGIPDYFKEHIIYYAGPAKKPEHLPSGSFGPTTSSRMDPYVPIFQKEGASLVTLAKGNRSDIVTQSCKENGGFYLGSIGGPAALLAQKHITNVELVEYEELGMEAIWAIDVKDFPAFIIVDDKGNNFFDMV